MHWTKHYKPVKDCPFPFQAYVEEDWVADHQKTEISIKKGDIIVVYGECEPDGHNAADVPRTSKRNMLIYHDMLSQQNTFLIARRTEELALDGLSLAPKVSDSILPGRSRAKWRIVAK